VQETVDGNASPPGAIVTAREQITVAMIEARDLQLAPPDTQLRACARRQPGCRALMGQFGVGETTAVTILAEPGDARRFSSLA
jgi:transposase